MVNITIETRYMVTLVDIIMAITVNIVIIITKVIAAMEVIMKNTSMKDQ